MRNRVRPKIRFPIPSGPAYRVRTRPIPPGPTPPDPEDPPIDPPPPDVIVDEYRLGKGTYFATMAIVNFNGTPTWTDPLTADWPTNTLRGNVFRRGYNWTVYRDACLARNPTLRVAVLGVNPADATLALYDIVTYTDSFGRALVQFNYEALEHLLSMFKFVVIQHAVPPITLARIAARSNVGTRFGHWLNYEAVNMIEEYTAVRRGLQVAQYNHLLAGTRVNANGVTHVDSKGSQAVPGYALGMPTGTPYTGHFLYTEVRDAAYSTDFMDALTTFDALYAADTHLFYFYDNTISTTYHGEAQFYNLPFSNAIRTAANSPGEGIPTGSELTPPSISNPAPLTYGQFRAGFATHMGNHNTSMTTIWGASSGGVQNMRNRIWGNCYWPVSSPAAEFTAELLPVPFFEYFWGQQAAGQTMQLLDVTRSYFQNFGSTDRPFVIAQLARTTDPQKAWLDSPGPGGLYGTWSDLFSEMVANNCTVIVQAARGVEEGWLLWQTGWLPPEGF